jgi:hypothetical protein
MGKKLTDLQKSYKASPPIGSYYFVVEDGSEYVVRIVDKFISLNSHKMMLEIKEILWSDTMQKPWTNVTYLELERLQNSRYSYADEEQIQKFEACELQELKGIKKAKRKKR